MYVFLSNSSNNHWKLREGYYRTGNICCRSEAMKRYIGTCLPHAGRYMQSRTGAVTQVSILPQSFFLLLPHHFFAIAASFFCFCRIIFFSSTLNAQKFSCYPTVTNPTAKGDNDINRRLYILTIRVICSQKDHQKESDIGEERFLQKLLFTTRYTCFHSFQPFFAVQTAMKRSPHPAGRALRTQRKFVALAWSRVTPPPLRYALRSNIYCQYGNYYYS